MKLAMIGSGKIVKEALFAACGIGNITICAIFARQHSRDTAETLAAEYSIPEVYTDYGELLASTAADTVYIGLVNSVHYEYAKQALLSGKHVILEKPFTGTVREAEELAAIARERHLILLEAITVMHYNLFHDMREHLPDLGEIRVVLANYSQSSSRYDAYLDGNVHASLDPQYQGGALRDINVYNIHYCAGLFGMPSEVLYFPNKGFNGVDTSGTLIMTYPGFQAVCTGAKDSDSPGFVSVQGESGWMKLSGRPNAPDTLDVAARIPVRGVTVPQYKMQHFEADYGRHRMTPEFRRFASIIDEGDFDAARELLEETLCVVRILEAVQGSCPLHLTGALSIP